MITTPVVEATPASQPPAARRLDQAQLPVIDIGPLLRPAHAREQDRQRVADAIGEAAHESGFFYIANHSLPPALFERTYAEAERFFSLPLATKLNYHIARSHNHRGYVPQSERGEYADERGERHYEAFDLALDLNPGDPDFHRAAQLLGPNVWPALPGFRHAVYGYYRALRGLADTLCRGFELHLGLESGYFRQFMRKPTSQLRLLHYLKNDAKPAAYDMQMGAHTDYECFTLLHQAKPGLQVLSTDNRWLQVPPLQDTLVVNIGDLLEVWTNGQFRATPHRVVNTGRERYSLPYFCAADFDTRVAPLPGMVGADRPARYRPITAGHHLLNQLLSDFSYLRRRYQSGALKLPFRPHRNGLFERRLALAGA